jgi:hypothetical protein
MIIINIYNIKKNKQTTVYQPNTNKNTNKTLKKGLKGLDVILFIHIQRQ